VAVKGSGVPCSTTDIAGTRRYHSLTILPDTLPEVLQVTARTEGGVIMGVQHVDLPIHGVQFHPESILTEGGHRMLANWLDTVWHAARGGAGGPAGTRGGRYRARGYWAKLSVMVSWASAGFLPPGPE